MNEPTMTSKSLKVLWREAKAVEVAAIAERRQIEDRILLMMPIPEATDSECTIAQDGVSVAYKMTRSVDTQALEVAWHDIPPAAQACFRWSADVDTKAMRGCKEFNPDAYAIAAKFIVAKPAKPTVTVKD